MAPKSPFADSPGHEFFLRRGQSQPQPFPPLNVAPFHLPQRSKVASGGEAALTATSAAQQHQHQHQQALFKQLFKAAELVEAGNTVSARGILARLNQQLPSPVGKSLLRSAFYFKEALHLLLHISTSQHHHPHHLPLLPMSTSQHHHPHHLLLYSSISLQVNTTTLTISPSSLCLQVTSTTNEVPTSSLPLHLPTTSHLRLST